MNLQPARQRRWRAIESWRRSAGSDARMLLVNPRSRLLSILPLALFFAVFPAQPLFGSNSKAEEQAGAVLFRDKGCAYCNGVDNFGSPYAVGDCEVASTGGKPVIWKTLFLGYMRRHMSTVSAEMHYSTFWHIPS